MEKKRILVIDDECDDLGCIEGILKKHKYLVTAESDPEKALRILAKKKFDLILIDILMPKISGYQLLKIIRSKFNQKIPLIYVSIVPKKEVDLKGADGFIQKPFTPEELAEEVKKALR